MSTHTALPSKVHSGDPNAPTVSLAAEPTGRPRLRVAMLDTSCAGNEPSRQLDCTSIGLGADFHFFFTAHDLLDFLIACHPRLLPDLITIDTSDAEGRRALDLVRSSAILRHIPTVVLVDEDDNDPR